MPAPLEDLNRDHQCHFYQAPSGQRCGSPALKGEYYCYHHHLKHATRNQRRVLIDPEITCMEIPTIEDRASIFIALAAVVHRLAENTIDTRRAGQMIYGLQVALQSLPPAPKPAAAQQACHPERGEAESKDPDTLNITTTSRTIPPTNARRPEQGEAESKNPDAPAPATIPISKESLLYFLRSRHCYNCNTELFPAEDLTERRNPGAPPEVIEEAAPRLLGPVGPSPVTPLISDAVILTLRETKGKDPCISSATPPSPPEETLATGGLTLHAVAPDPISNLEPRTWSPALFHFRPFSWIIEEVVRGLTAPLSVRKLRIGCRDKTLCRGVSNAACQPKWLATLGEQTNARDHHTAVSGVQEPELLNHQEQEDDHRPA